MRRPYRSPLVIFTPKSLLRHPRASSRPEEFANGGFRPVLDDEGVSAERVQRVVLCSGKIYYELLAERERRFGEAAHPLALVRIEQLYPWPDVEIATVLERYANADSVFWVQEEPANMGPWTFVRERIQHAVRADQKLGYAGRPESASPAAGSLRIHKQEQSLLLDTAFLGLD